MALRRLGFGYDRERDEDRVLDYLFGLEALLVQGRSAVTLKLAVHTGALLAVSPADRERIYGELSDAYDLRSSLAHGAGLEGDVSFGERYVSLQAICPHHRGLFA